jgi:hypothetical protein
MFETEDPTSHVAARMLEYFGRRTPWQRRLWNVGSILALDEAIEAAHLVRGGHLSAGALRDLSASLQTKLGKDPGIGGPEVRKRMQAVLKTIHDDDRSLKELEYLSHKASDGYLERWHDEVLTDREHGNEYVSRILGGHLLDAGFSPDHLYRWVSSMGHDATRTIRLPALFTEAMALLDRPSFAYQVLVPMTAIPERSTLPDEWLDASAASSWLRDNAGAPAGVRHNGGFLFSIDALDPWAAVERASDILRAFNARLTVGLPADTVFLSQSKAWIAGKEKAFGFSSPRRQVDVHSLDRQNAIFTIDAAGPDQRMSAALELLATFETSSPGTAVAGGWAAIETLLSRPNSPNVNAAEDLAVLVACSFPRAELTTLSYRYAKDHADATTAQLDQIVSNRNRAAFFADELRAGHALEMADTSDRAATERMRELINAPQQTLRQIKTYVSEAFRRLYRQRNLVLHAGTMESVALRPVLRTVPPLVGAGIDRIVHAALTNPPQTSAELVAKASAEMNLVGKPGGAHIVDLLGA